MYNNAELKLCVTDFVRIKISIWWTFKVYPETTCVDLNDVPEKGMKEKHSWKKWRKSQKYVKCAHSRATRMKKDQWLDG